MVCSSDWFNMGFESYIWEGEVKEGLEGHEKTRIMRNNEAGNEKM